MAKFLSHKREFFFIYVALALLTTLEFIEKNFGGVRIEQIFFFLADEGGVVGTDSALFTSAFLLIILKPIVLILAGYGARRMFDIRFKRVLSQVTDRIPRISILAIRGAAASRWLFQHSWILSCLSALYLIGQVGGASAVTRSYGEDLFSKFYVAPVEPKTLIPPPEKNLVILYVESLESSLRNEAVFGENLLAPIDEQFGKEPLKLHQSPGTGWTTAGMVSSQCAVPLQNFMGNRLGHKNGKILASATCIGDYLSKFGYQQYFYVGPDLKFSGMDKFYSAHGYQHLIGRDQLKTLGIDGRLFSGWGAGVHDDTLLDAAYAQIESMHLNGTRFNVAIITTDNHAPEGFPSERCTAQERMTGFTGTFRCTSRQIGVFLNRLDRAGILENTVVVLMGDHLFFNNPNHQKFFSKTAKRYVYFNFIDRSAPANMQYRERLTHFDVAPTVMEMITGYTGKFSRLGLGISLSDSDSDKYQRHLNAVTSEAILNHSDLYRSLWISPTANQ
jgi:phosphoglycerol transferase